jgi:glycosyltransferase involved in cell wall biosynthesis
VTSVHDVSFLEHPELFPWQRVKQLRITVARTVRTAARILTPSEFSARSIRKAYGVAEEKITVVPNGVGAHFRPMARDVAAAHVREKFGIAGPYILMVGDLQPRKNQAGLIRAFEELIRTQPQLRHTLVLTGQDSWFASVIRDAAQRSPASGRIKLTGFVGDADLPYLYGGADLFVFPSFYEGFGIPILEAMACGRAVACSNTTAVVETADGAAIVFDPHSTAGMTRAMKDLLIDAEMRARYERLGLQRAQSFSWRDAARRTLDVYHEVAESRRRVVAAKRATAVEQS